MLRDEGVRWAGQSLESILECSSHLGLGLYTTTTIGLRNPPPAEQCNGAKEPLNPGPMAFSIWIGSPAIQAIFNEELCLYACTDR